MLTLGEGSAPLVALPRWGASVGLPDARAMLEFLSPTGSFKDRGAVMVVQRLANGGFDRLVEDSSGNAGAALAAYAAAAGLHCEIFAPGAADAPKLAQMRAFGASVTVVPGARAKAAAAALSTASLPGAVYASHVRDPAFLLGMKTFIFDTCHKSGGRLPDHIVFPTGNGGLLLGSALGIADIGETKGRPRLHAAQARECAPLVAGAGISTGGKTIASGIAVAAPERLDQVRSAISNSGGTVKLVTDNQIRRACSELARFEGIYLEPTAAAGFAAAAELARAGLIRGDESVVIPATGSGLKANQ